MHGLCVMRFVIEIVWVYGLCFNPDRVRAQCDPQVSLHCSSEAAPASIICCHVLSLTWMHIALAGFSDSVFAGRI